jgi:hypothetical protein
MVVFETQHGDLISSVKFYVIFLSLSRRMIGWQVKISHDHFHSFQDHISQLCYHSMLASYELKKDVMNLSKDQSSNRYVPTTFLCAPQSLVSLRKLFIASLKSLICLTYSVLQLIRGSEKTWLLHSTVRLVYKSNFLFLFSHKVLQQ